MPAAGRFVLWGVDHLVVLLLTAAAVLALILNATHLRGVEDRTIRRGMAALLLANELVALAVAAAQGVVRVPLQLCDLALFLTVFALWTLHAGVTEVVYFWGLTGSLQALLTPDLRRGFPDYWWLTFFITHCGVVLSVVYLAVSGRVVPTSRSIWRVWAVTNLYAAAAGLINWTCGTNYGYLARKPMQPSLLDYFGPWPYYLLVMEGAALIMFGLCYVPFVFIRRSTPREVMKGALRGRS